MNSNFNSSEFDSQNNSNYMRSNSIQEQKRVSYVDNNQKIRELTQERDNLKENVDFYEMKLKEVLKSGFYDPIQTSYYQLNLDNKRLTTQNDQLITENKSLKSQFMTYESQISQLQNDNNSLKIQLKSQTELSEKKLQELRVQINGMTISNNQEKNVQTTQETDQNAIKQSLETKISELQNQLQSMTSQNTNLNNEFEIYKQTYNNNNNTIHEQILQSNEYKTLNEAYSDLYSQYSTLFDIYKSDETSVKSKYWKTIKSLQEYNENYQSILKQHGIPFEKISTTIENNLKTLDQEISSNKQIETLNHKLEELQRIQETQKNTINSYQIEYNTKMISLRSYIYTQMKDLCAYAKKQSVSPDVSRTKLSITSNPTSSEEASDSNDYYRNKLVSQLSPDEILDYTKEQIFTIVNNYKDRIDKCQEIEQTKQTLNEKQIDLLKSNQVLQQHYESLSTKFDNLKTLLLNIYHEYKNILNLIQVGTTLRDQSKGQAYSMLVNKYKNLDLSHIETEIQTVLQDVSSSSPVLDSINVTTDNDMNGNEPTLEDQLNTSLNDINNYFSKGILQNNAYTNLQNTLHSYKETLLQIQKDTDEQQLSLSQLKAILTMLSSSTTSLSSLHSLFPMDLQKHLKSYPVLNTILNTVNGIQETPLTNSTILSSYLASLRDYAISFNDNLPKYIDFITSLISDTKITKDTLMKEQESLVKIEKEKYVSLLREKTELEKQHQEDVETIQKLHSEMDIQMNQVNSQYESQLHILKEQLNQKDQLMNLRNNDINEYKKSIQQQKSFIDNHQSINDINEKNIRELTTRIDQLMKSIQQLTGQYTNQNNIIQNQTKTLSDAQKQYDIKQNEYNILLSQYKDLEKQYTNLKQSKSEEGNQIVQRKDYYKSITKQLQVVLEEKDKKISLITLELQERGEVIKKLKRTVAYLLSKK